MQEAINARLKETEQIMQKAIQALGAVSAEIRTELIEGNPAEVIIEVAQTHNSNLIVMGSRGLGAWNRLLLGSVSSGVIHHAKCSVEVVRQRHAA